MHSFHRRVSSVCALLNWLAVGSLICMMCLTCGDIVFRLFRRPIIGTWEIVGFLGALSASFALAQTTLRRGHVAVQILVDLFPQRVQTWVYLATHLCSLLLFALLSLESVRYGNSLRIAGEVSPTLQIPFFPVLYAIAFSSLMVCLVLGIDLIRVVAGKESAWYEWPESF